MDISVSLDTNNISSPSASTLTTPTNTTIDNKPQNDTNMMIVSPSSTTSTTATTTSEDPIGPLLTGMLQDITSTIDTELDNVINHAVIVAAKQYNELVIKYNNLEKEKNI